MKLTNKQLQKMHKIQLEMLEEFDRICTKHNLKYILVGGTLLGAIRHNGFIPWDDDIDISMLREDYNKLIEIQKKELNKKKYYFQSPETDPEIFGNIFAKIRRKNSIYCEKISNTPEDKQGIWIDIFPLDNIPDNNIILKIHFIKVFILKIMYTKKMGNTNYSNSLPKKIILKLIEIYSIFYSKEQCRNKLYKNMNKYNKKNTKRFINYGGRYLLKEALDKKMVNERIKHQFEEGKYYIPKDYNEFLINFYGNNYMQLPPIEKRNQEHIIEKIKFPD